MMRDCVNDTAPPLVIPAPSVPTLVMLERVRDTVVPLSTAAAVPVLLIDESTSTTRPPEEIASKSGLATVTRLSSVTVPRPLWSNVAAAQFWRIVWPLP